jgi:6-phosphogluconolactonase
METIIRISQNEAELAIDLAKELAALINKAGKKGKVLTVALSGGNTPRLLFSILGEQYTSKVSWKSVHFFWGDERCVPPEDINSNYGMTKKLLLDKIDIPARNIHRLRGEDDPEKEALRYSREINKFTVMRWNFPVFDIIILGLGEDGHTASIFPGNERVMKTDKVCAVTVDPGSGQKRITLTRPVINNAINIIFLVSGSNKARIISEILDNPDTVDYPAASIKPVFGQLKWYLDLDAATDLSQWA